METHRRGSDGRRLFTAEFKQEQIARVTRQELTLAELARELAVTPSVVRRWQRLSLNGSAAAVSADEDVVPATELRAAEQRIRSSSGPSARRPWRSRFSRPRGTR